ncbi:MAG: response regulator [bacterium]
MACILCIDDDATVLMMLEKLLKHAGHSVLKANTARKGLRTVAGGKVDLIILDVMMPGMNGVEMLKKLKDSELTASIPVIMFSGCDEDEIKQQAFGEYIENFIVKGTPLNEIRARIEKILALRPPK